MSQYNQYNQYIYRNGEWLLIGDGGSSATYTLSKSGNNLVLSGSDGSSSTVSLSDIIVRWVPNMAYSQGDSVFYNGSIYQANRNLAPSQTFGTISHTETVNANFNVNDIIPENDKCILDGSSFMEKLRSSDHGRSLIQYFYDSQNQQYITETPIYIIKGDQADYDNYGIFLFLRNVYEEDFYLSFSFEIVVLDAYQNYSFWTLTYEGSTEEGNEYYYTDLQDANGNYLNIDTYNFSEIYDIGTWGTIITADNTLATNIGLSLQHSVTTVIVGDWTNVFEISNATATNVGGIKMRLDTLTNILYITNDGSDA